MVIFWNLISYLIGDGKIIKKENHNLRLVYLNSPKKVITIIYYIYYYVSLSFILKNNKKKYLKKSIFKKKWCF